MATLQHARASPGGKQRRRAAAIHMRRADNEADGVRVAEHLHRAQHAVPARNKRFALKPGAHFLTKIGNPDKNVHSML